MNQLDPRLAADAVDKLQGTTPMRLDPSLAIAIAKQMQDEIDSLLGQIDELLQPVVDEAVAQGYEAVEELVSQLPSGFYRSELRVWLRESREEYLRNTDEH